MDYIMDYILSTDDRHQVADARSIKYAVAAQRCKGYLVMMQ